MLAVVCYCWFSVSCFLLLVDVWCWPWFVSCFLLFVGRLSFAVCCWLLLVVVLLFVTFLFVGCVLRAVCCWLSLVVVCHLLFVIVSYLWLVHCLSLVIIGCCLSVAVFFFCGDCVLIAIVC